MNEPEILEAYRDLSTPTSPPADLLATVDRRIRRRRTTRRGVAGVAALAVAGGIGVLTLGGDDGGKDSLVADQGATDSSTLTYTGADGSTHTFAASDIGVVCWTRSDGLQVLTLARNEALPAAAVGEPWDKVTGPVLHVELLVERVEPGRVFDLPFETVSGSSDRRPMTFFFTDGTSDESNELSSAEAGSSGTVTVNEASCGAQPALDVEIAGTLGSEVGQPALAIEGRYRS